MTQPTLAELIELARHYKMSEAERDAQARSFAYGNVHLENSKVTHAHIDAAAERKEEGVKGR